MNRSEKMIELEENTPILNTLTEKLKSLGESL